MPSYRHSWEPISCVFPQTLISSCVCLGWAATHHFTRRMKHAFSPRSWRQNMLSTRPTGTKSLSQVGRKHLFWWSVITATCRPSGALQHRHYSNLFKMWALPQFKKYIFVNNCGLSWFLQRRTLSGTCWRRTLQNATQLNKRSLIHGEKHLWESQKTSYMWTENHD